ncbi:MAG: hypothetical protein OXH00_17755 [Candidatus Poribacteria bacterium]|nr:hypothetical protein [Candidatus Poribacteria bacterium]
MKTKTTLTFFVLFSFLSLNAFAQVRLKETPEVLRLSLNLFALSPDGETLAGSNFKGDIHLWDTATGSKKDVFISEFRIGAGAVLTFSPDGTLLASGSEQSRVTLWDVATGNAKFVLEHVGANTISSISFSPDGTTLVSCAAGRWGTSSAFIYLWDVKTGKKKSEIEVPDFPTCSTFSPDGTTLAIGTAGFREKAVNLFLWDIHENLEIAKLEIVTPTPPWGVDYLKFSPDGTALAAGIGDSLLITLWDVVTRKETGRLFGYYGRAWNAPFAFSPDGMILAGTGATTGTNAVGHTFVNVDGLYLWNVFNEKSKKISEPSMFAGVSPDGTFYAVEDQREIIDGDWVDSQYFLWTISPEGVSMEVTAHGKLTTSWGQIKQEQ